MFYPGVGERDNPPRRRPREVAGAGQAACPRRLAAAAGGASCRPASVPGLVAWGPRVGQAAGVIAILRAFASAAGDLGRVTCSTPFWNRAVTLASSTGTGIAMRRMKEP